MTTVTDLKAKLQAALSEVDVIVSSIVREDEEEILDLIRIDQIWDEGIQGDGSPLVSTNSTIGFYSRLTQEMNQGISFNFKSRSRQKLFRQTYFLFDSGTFFRSMEAVFDFSQRAILIIDNTPPIPGKGTMEQEYGEKLLFLTPENTDFLNQEIIKPKLWPSLIKLIEKG